MKTVGSSEEALAQVLSALPGIPRVVSSGNFAAPSLALRVLDGAVECFRLNVLNAQTGLPDREGITLETSFVGPGMRFSPRLRYVPSRLSLVPRLFATTHAA